MNDSGDSCLASGTSRCDLGGNTEVVWAQPGLAEGARRAGVSVVPDCGMGPGLISHTGTYVMELLDRAREVVLSDGGLPLDPRNPCRHELTFHVNGLTNEYDGAVTFIRVSQLVQVPTLTELETVLVDRYDRATGFASMARLTGWHAAIVMIPQADGCISPGAHRMEQAVTGSEVIAELERRGIAHGVRWEKQEIEIMALARRVFVAVALVAVVSSGLAASPADELRGFAPRTATRERDVEAALRAIPSPERAREWHRRFTAEPHPAGSEENNALARFIADEWRGQGLEDVVVHRYDVLNTAPREVSLVMVAPVRYEASLREDPYEVDPDTKNPRVSPGYLGLSASAEVEAPVVYAHSGNPEDYAYLRAQGIDVRGKIALVRYSNPYSYRGFKALTAEREGAAGILIYSDPAEDGFARGPVFPEGPWGPESHIQRGAITYDFIVPGDPLTPGWPSLPGAPRVRLEEARSLPRIAGLPLSWEDAKPLLENMDGPVAPREWQGGLPIEYRLGGERVRVHMKVDMDNSVGPNLVVEGRIRGSELPDEWVVLGNHRDAWEFGGVDPSSGTASMMELTRAFGELARRGMRPRRTLVFCSWDGEEVGLTGSTEWGEHFAPELRARAVAYLNVDSSASGPDFQPQAVGSLAPLVLEVARDFEDPATGGPLVNALRALRTRESEKTGETGPAPDADLVDVRIGSGSDHTVFLNHLGVPTVNLSFDGPYGVYHSVYDGFYWMNQFGDPGYRYHVLLAQIWGTLALRLANADLLPFDLAAQARHLRAFAGDLERVTESGRLDLSGLTSHIDDFEMAGERLNEASRQALASGGPSPDVAERVNRGLLEVERHWLDPEGLPGRPWFRHTLYAARFTYAHLEMPGVTEAVEEGDWDRAARQAAVLERAVARNAALLEELARALAGGGSSTDR